MKRDKRSQKLNKERVTFFWGAIETTEKAAGDFTAVFDRRKRGRTGLERNCVLGWDDMGALTAIGGRSKLWKKKKKLWDVFVCCFAVRTLSEILWGQRNCHVRWCLCGFSQSFSLALYLRFSLVLDNQHFRFNFGSVLTFGLRFGSISSKYSLL